MTYEFECLTGATGSCGANNVCDPAEECWPICEPSGGTSCSPNMDGDCSPDVGGVYDECSPYDSSSDNNYDDDY